LSTSFRKIAGVPNPPAASAAFRVYRNSKLYRSLTRTLRVYNRLLIAGLRARGFTDFSPAFPSLLSNLDTDGTRIGVLALRAGVTRQAAGQLLREIERCGYAERRSTPDDARATLVHFTPKGRRMLSTVIELVEDIEGSFAAELDPSEFERVREGLLRIANRIDPEGALGAGDKVEDGRRGEGAKGRRAAATTMARGVSAKKRGRAPALKP
jgi:DNA-binding MarR family transcriptional regulator